MDYHVMAVKIGDRRANSPDVQKVLSHYGCSIKMRLGLHEAETECSDEGLLLLQLTGDTEEIKALEQALNDMESVSARTISI